MHSLLFVVGYVVLKFFFSSIPHYESLCVWLSGLLNKSEQKHNSLSFSNQRMFVNSIEQSVEHSPLLNVHCLCLYT